MKAMQTLSAGVILLGVFNANGQGTLTFIYDQQSVVANTAPEGGSSLQTAQPFGQSFTPSLSTVGFVQLDLFSSASSPASLYVNLRSDSINGPILGITDTITLAGPFDVQPSFIFSTPVSVTSGTTYYFQPVLISGATGVGGEFVFDYPGGSEIFQGAPSAGGRDLWFREGILVPEPSAWALLLVSGGAIALGWRRRKKASGGKSAQ
jgi:PEP-CTERM motif